jgi:hypothetical protein
MYKNNMMLACHQKIKALAFFCTGCLLTVCATAQNTVTLTDLSAFQKASASWRLAGDVAASLEKSNVLSATPGTGILVNLPDKNNQGVDLITNLQHGDVDVELDFMMAKGSNSGVYLQGRYEVQLLDSWGVKRPRYGDNGGVYERWDESRGKGAEGYEGYAPRQNVSLAPGLWQHLKIAFQAPRFDAAGRKTENARMLRVELNGVVLHEDVELSGPTRGALEGEVPAGPLRLQGDHGAVAFRNLRITNYDKPRPELTNLHYTVYKGRFEGEPDFKKLPPEAEGSSVVLSSNLSHKLQNEYLIRYTGTLKVQEPGEYRFNMNVPGGAGMMRVNNQVVVPVGGWQGTGKVNLPAGDLPFELLYSKFVDWTKPALGLAVAGPSIREYLISDANTAAGDAVDPILIDAPANTVLRSFMDLPNSPRVVHAVNVGSADQVHYTYDLDNGTIIQAWRGGFLDATPMWHDRGDGSSRPVGTVVRFGKPIFSIAQLASAQASWITDSAGTGYRAKGYVLDEQDRPTFRYQIYGTMVNDAIRVAEGGKGLQREISVQDPGANLFVRLASADKIESAGDGLYMLNDKTYYLRINDAGGATPVVRDAAGGKELLLPLKTKLSYSIIF